MDLVVLKVQIKLSNLSMEMCFEARGDEIPEFTFTDEAKAEDA